MPDQQALLKASFQYPWGPPILDTVYNRTGGATIVGGCYQFDTGLTAAAESDGSALPAVSDYSRSNKGAFANVVLPVTEKLYNGMFCCAQEVKADNKPVRVTVIGEVDYVVLVTIAGAITLEAWGKLVPQNASAVFNGFTAAGAGATATGKLVGATLAAQVSADGTTQYQVPALIQGLYGWR